MTAFRDEKTAPSRYVVIRWLGLDQFEPERAATSHFISSHTLLYIRIPLVLYTFAVLYGDIIWTWKSGGMNQFFAYFTDLTFIGLHAYLVTTTYHHICYLRTKQEPISYLTQPSVLNYLYVYLYHSVVTFNLATTTVYWTLLSKDFLAGAYSNPVDRWLVPSLHGASLFMMLVDQALNRMKLHIRLVLLIIFNMFLYMFLTFVVYAIQHWWVYSFLDWDQGPSAALWYGAILVFVIICFFLQVGFHALRDWIALRCCTPKGKLPVGTGTPAVRQQYFSPLESSIASHITLGGSLGGSSTVQLNATY